MEKWEYKIENLYIEEDWTQASIKDWLRLLNRHGTKGWELVSIRDNLAYFKRPIEKELDKIEPFDPREIGKFTSVGKPLE